MSRAVDRGHSSGRSDVMRSVSPGGAGRACAFDSPHYRRKRDRKELIAKQFTNQARARENIRDRQQLNFLRSCSSRSFSATRAELSRRGRGKKGLFEVADGGSIFWMRSETFRLKPSASAASDSEREFTPLGDTTTPRRVEFGLRGDEYELKEA